MIEEEIKKEIIDIINKNRYYVSKKEICKILVEIIDDISPINDESISKELQDIIYYTLNDACRKVRIELNKYYIFKATQ